MEKKLKNIQTFEQHTDKNLNISDVSYSSFLDIKDEIFYKYHKETENDEYQQSFIEWMKDKYPQFVKYYLQYKKEL